MRHISATMRHHFLPFLFLLLSSSASASPILAPDLKYCHLPLNLPDGESPFNCCAPNWDLPAIAFSFPNFTSIRVRSPAHLLDFDAASKLDRAYGLMRALPPEDPRSFIQQANIHCAYCSATYQMGNSSTPFQVHASWLFFAFHRWYLYFHERILAHLLGGDDESTFAIPFWNYDHPDGMTIPDAFVAFPNLTDVYRDPSRLPPATVMIDYYYMNASIRTAQEQVAANLATIHRMVVSGATTKYSFHGQPYRMDSAPEPGYGTVETMPHNSMHGWTGDQFQVGGKDMGTLYAAGRDPVFYTHHANIDRLWEVWKTLDGNEDIDDYDYLNSEFVFYDELAQLVKVKVKDSLDPLALGFTYADVENLWINVSVPSLSSGVARLSDGDKVCVMGEALTEPCSVELSMGAALSEEEAEAVVVVEGIEGEMDKAAHFEAFVNLPEAAEIGATANCTEFAGRYSTLQKTLYTEVTGKKRKTAVRFAVGGNIEELGLEGEEKIVVTLVPRVEEPYEAVVIGGVRLEYDKEGVSKAVAARRRKKKKEAAAAEGGVVRRRRGGGGSFNI